MNFDRFLANLIDFLYYGAKSPQNLPGGGYFYRLSEVLAIFALYLRLEKTRFFGFPGPPRENIRFLAKNPILAPFWGGFLREKP